MAEMAKVYALQTGECEIQQKAKAINHRTSELSAFENCKWVTLCKVGPGSIIGEEILLQQKDLKYKYRVVVS